MICRNKPNPLPGKLRRRARAHYFALAPCFVLLLFGCAGLPLHTSGKVKYNNPPKVGTWLKSQRELVACETVVAARYMADFGFFHPLCEQLTDIGPQDYLVAEREIVQLREGPMWLLTVEKQQRVFYVPIPWHDWL